MVGLFTLGSAILLLPFAIAQNALVFPVAYLFPGIVAVLLQAVSNICFVRALMLAPFSTVIPILSLTPAVSALLAIPILRETPSLYGWGGIALVVAGALWITSVKTGLSEDAAKVADTRKGVLLMCITAILWSLAPSIDKLCLRHVDHFTHTNLMFWGIAIAMVAVLGFKGDLKQLSGARKAPFVALIVIITCIAAIAIQNLALTYDNITPASLESTKRGIGMTMALLIGKVFYKEAIGVQKILAVIAMLAGVLLILQLG
jgi:drug/metabolite transporter (DMT)-like permease